MTIQFTILEDKVYRLLQLPHKTIYQIYIPGRLRELLLQMQGLGYYSRLITDFESCLISLHEKCDFRQLMAVEV